MAKLTFVANCTAILAVTGFYMGLTIDGPTPSAFIPAVAGGAAGFGIGCSLLDVAKRWRVARANR